jgi:hypothetical protein
MGPVHCGPGLWAERFSGRLRFCLPELVDSGPTVEPRDQADLHVGEQHQNAAAEKDDRPRWAQGWRLVMVNGAV